MKKIFFALLITCSSYSQNKMQLNPKGFEPVVTEMEGQTSAQLFEKTKMWVQTYYKNPKEVSAAEIQNEMIRINGYSGNCYETKALGMTNVFGCTYSIEIEFKEGKYLYTMNINEMTSRGQRVLYTYKDFFKDSGEVRKVYAKSVETMNSTANNIYNSLFDYLSGKVQTAKKDW
ncbi:MAG: DUF4468 domain-containing protein [Bacteroidota bacterium]